MKEDLSKKYGWKEVDSGGTVVYFLKGEDARRYAEVFGGRAREHEQGDEEGSRSDESDRDESEKEA